MEDPGAGRHRPYERSAREAEGRPGPSWRPPRSRSGHDPGRGPRQQVHVVRGDPGVGKTTLALHFARVGAEAGETVLFVATSESEEEIHGLARSHGWSLEGVTVHSLDVGEIVVGAESAQSVFHPAEVELPRTMEALFSAVDAIRLQRVVIDSVSELRLLVGDRRWYRRQVLVSPGGLGEDIRRVVEEQGVRMIVLDSLTGLLRSIHDQDLLSVHLHELSRFLARHGVSLVLTMVQHGLPGSPGITSVDLSYFLGRRHPSAAVRARRRGPEGGLRLQAPGRSPRDDNSGAEDRAQGPSRGPALARFRGVLTGVPHFLEEVLPSVPSQERARDVG